MGVMQKWMSGGTEGGKFQFGYQLPGECDDDCRYNEARESEEKATSESSGSRLGVGQLFVVEFGVSGA